MKWFVLAGLVLTFLTALLGYLQSRKNQARIIEVHLAVLTAAGVPVPEQDGPLPKSNGG